MELSYGMAAQNSCQLLVEKLLGIDRNVKMTHASGKSGEHPTVRQ